MRALTPGTNVLGAGIPVVGARNRNVVMDAVTLRTHVAGAGIPVVRARDAIENESAAVPLMAAQFLTRIGMFAANGALIRGRVVHAMVVDALIIEARPIVTLSELSAATPELVTLVIDGAGVPVVTVETRTRKVVATPVYTFPISAAISIVTIPGAPR